MKQELVHRHHFTTRAQARQAVFSWIHTWYNRRRLHSPLGYARPRTMEARSTAPPSRITRVRLPGGGGHSGMRVAIPRHRRY
ncbi:IS3 family transposase [Halosaccharopolyspora lacisalsi]|uniref:IS3 family transposase n=1 Tax=Halosaccharopolyspora lacisalsi TaxID=1000566 RepID=UPI0038B41491